MQPSSKQTIGNFFISTFDLKCSIKQYWCKLCPQEIGHTVDKVIGSRQIGHYIPKFIVYVFDIFIIGSSIFINILFPEFYYGFFNELCLFTFDSLFNNFCYDLY